MRLINTALLFLLLILSCKALGLKPQLLGRHTAQTNSQHTSVSYKTFYFDQQIDHFGFLENGTFKQRYLLNDQHWHKEGGPILFYTGNEGDITWFCNNTGFMWDVAEDLGALLVFAEHRYYGESMPFGEESYSNAKYLNYLTSEQALADFAVLIKALKKTLPGAQKSSVIAIGGSYGGMLAAWLRMKYPSAVVGFSFIGEGLQWLSQEFGLCNPLKTPDEVYGFKAWLQETWVNLAMVDYPYEANFLQPLPAWPVKVVCKNLHFNTGVSDKQLLNGISQAVRVYYNYTGDAVCLNTSQTATGNLGFLGWFYQSCTEMVMPICTDGVADMFEPQPWNFQAFSDECYNQFRVRPREDWAEIVYGGRNISAHSNIIFSNGNLDPWMSGGVTRSLSESLVAIMIDGGAHHLDLRYNSEFDPESVIKTRALEVRYFKQWIKQAATTQ
ncbi:lysosomal Pro-X carboxypeptidase-like [Sinocyclocheilus rhinocerous]|uniref:lysosomal Pro-X carboxypeptidase-like n=1 Tax=Sinocyclocheilus rhinocerous TaxID=307959 RepID=UPI0007B88077|nr:PREDICTED: lysosomal Pro-X carboxypeptidase-like [Sinocyclocheilus rhinocerous]